MTPGPIAGTPRNRRQSPAAVAPGRTRGRLVADLEDDPVDLVAVAYPLLAVDRARQRLRHAPEHATECACCPITMDRLQVMPMMPALLTADEVAERWKVEPSTVYRWAREGVVPSVRIGGIVRFPARELEAMAEAHDQDHEESTR